MPKLPSSEEIITGLRKKGFVFVSQKGSHAKFRKYLGSSILTTIIPMERKEIPIGTFRSILRQSGLRKEDFK
ncbi:MAG: type II toxin-antitoxin system HicA family toxin [bacterium]|nr:type II toxin-antitoxin system HicA family toxin [bacterium]